MTFPAKSVIFVAGVGGTVTAGFGGAYLHSKETIGSKLGDAVLGIDDSFKDSWKNQHTKLTSETLDLKGFPELSKIKKNTDQNKSWEELKDWCSKSYSFTYKTIFSKEDNTRLDLTKKYCIQTSKEKLEAMYKGDSKKVLDVTGERDKNEFINNYKKLENHNEESDGKLTGALLGIDKGKASSEADANWTKVREWCSNIHNQPFKGQVGSFKLAEKLCVKGN
ncbi:hypothetical protein MHC_05000 [Mycoplasma haemocanis str. Illinois]|uniref:Uncharacterized protein n=1 Tax=Mycoplasma haemocanis (strain Illinois) TaxID=1111676 RepID=H6N884_MYCHN|nr:hypothetical protein [Mycoplasma haemocanis]AEW45856.1 hypothetical protein MHC_05000 [Mycoplasma haemocanis str. Illinois]